MIKKRKKKKKGEMKTYLRKRKRSDSLEAEEDEEHRSKILKLVSAKKKLVVERDRTVINTKTGSVDESQHVKIRMKKKVGGKYDAGLSQYTTLEKLKDTEVTKKFDIFNPRELQEKIIFDSMVKVVERDEDLDDDDDDDDGDGDDNDDGSKEGDDKNITNEEKKKETVQESETE